MNYQKELVWALRLRRLGEQEIADIVAEVAAHEQTGGDPSAFFGEPATYAAQFPEGKRRFRDLTLWSKVAAGTAVVWMVAVILVTWFGDVELPVRFGVILLWPALVMMLAGMLVDIVRGRHRPVRPSR